MYGFRLSYDINKRSVNNPLSKLEKEKFCTVFIPNTNRYNAKKMDT